MRVDVTCEYEMAPNYQIYFNPAKKEKKKGEIRLQVLCVGQRGGENEVAIVTPGLVRAFPGKQYLPINQKKKEKKTEGTQRNCIIT